MINQGDLRKSIRDAISFALSNLHTATIAKVSAVGDTTIDCEPVINRVVNGSEIKLPVFQAVPPVFLSGGDSYTAHPIAVGDYCLLIFTERCFDRWYSGNDFRAPAEFRMHDYSDGIAIVGLFPAADAIQIPSVITRVGDSYHDGSHIQDGNYELNGDQEINGDLEINGNLVVNGTITCSNTITTPFLNVLAGLTIGGLNFSSHRHGGVQPGTGISGGPQ